MQYMKFVEVTQIFGYGDSSESDTKSYFNKLKAKHPKLKQYMDSDEEIIFYLPWPGDLPSKGDVVNIPSLLQGNFEVNDISWTYEQGRLEATIEVTNVCKPDFESLEREIKSLAKLGAFAFADVPNTLLLSLLTVEED